MTKLCECSVAGFCKRYNRKMAGRLYELCAGINCTPEQSESYRKTWDASISQHGTTTPDIVQSVTTNQQPIINPEFQATEEEKNERPDLVTMGFNALKEYRCWKSAGKPVVTEKIFNERKSLCVVCDKYDKEKDRCNSCGCPMSTTGNNWISSAIAWLGGNTDQLGALWWGTKSCPHPSGPKWKNTVNCDGTSN